jgi:tRNA(fMet)-specific endonuclease VapC
MRPEGPVGCRDRGPLERVLEHGKLLAEYKVAGRRRTVAMTRFCLDTSAYSHFKRGDGGAIKSIISATRIYMPTIVLGELRTRFRLGSRADSNEEALQQFVAEPVVSVLDVDEQAASIYADIVVALRRSGTPVPTNDIWIAALAAREGATVLTFDEHFCQIARVGTRLLAPS